MRLRHIPGAEQMIEDSPYVIQNPEERKESGMRFSEITIRYA